MNNKRRTEIETIKNNIQKVLDEEQEAFDNIPE